MYGFRGLIETAESGKNFNNIIYTQKGSFLQKTTSEKIWIPRSDIDIRNGFRPWIRALGGIVCWKKPRVENLVTLPLNVKVGSGLCDLREATEIVYF
jgi:hypothetical protein